MFIFFSISHMKNFILTVILLTIILACNRENKNSSIELICNAETLTSDSTKFCFDGKIYEVYFGDGWTQSAEQAHSGKYSAKLNKVRPYGMTYKIRNVKPNDRFEFSVWKLNNGKKGALVIREEEKSEYYFQSDTISEKENNNWGKIKHNMVIPASLGNKNLLIYCWHPDTVDSSYFDDLMIRYLK